MRYFFAMRKADSQLVFDIDLARAQSEENPVYYIQMAHARLCGIFRVGEIDPATLDAAAVDFDASRSRRSASSSRRCSTFRPCSSGAAEALEPHRVANYLHDTAQLVHTWYHKHHVLDEPATIMNARLFLANAAAS